MSQGNPKGKGGTVLMSNFNAPQPGAPGGPPPGGMPPEAPYGGQPGAPPGGGYGAPPAAPYGGQPGGAFGGPPGAPYGGQPGAPPGGGYGPPPGGGYGAPPGGGYGPPPGGGPPGAPYGGQPGGAFGGPPDQGQGWGAPPGGPGMGGPGGAFGGAMAAGGAMVAGGSGGTAIPDYVPGEKTQTLGLDQNLAAAISHFIGILALVFAFTEPKHHRFIRFYSFQLIFVGVAATIVSILLSIVSFVLTMILPSGLEFLAGLIFLPLMLLGPLGLFSAYKAFQGKVWKFPVIGGFAEKFVLKD